MVIPQIPDDVAENTNMDLPGPVSVTSSDSDESDDSGSSSSSGPSFSFPDPSNVSIGDVPGTQNQPDKNVQDTVDDVGVGVSIPGTPFTTTPSDDSDSSKDGLSQKEKNTSSSNSSNSSSSGPSSNSSDESVSLNEFASVLQQQSGDDGLPVKMLALVGGVLAVVVALGGD